MCGLVQRYRSSIECLQAIRDYVENECKADAKALNSTAIFLPKSTVPQSPGGLAVNIVNQIWIEVVELAGAIQEGKMPCSARRAIGRLIIEMTGNIAAVLRQLGPKNAAYSI